MKKKLILYIVLVLLLLQIGNSLPKESLNIKKTEIIKIVDAEHLDSNRNYLSNIYDKVKDLDEKWIRIKNKNFIRITFEKNLTNKNDITIYAKGDNSIIKVYKKNTFDEIAKFENVSQKNWYKIYLNKLNDKENYSIFDLELLGDVEFNYILDPTTTTSITSIFDDGNVSNTATCSAYTRDKSGSVLTTGKTGGGSRGTSKSLLLF